MIFWQNSNKKFFMGIEKWMGAYRMSKLMMSAIEVAKIMDCSERHGYKLIQVMNEELKAKGYIIRAGRVPRKYFFERVGLEDQEGCVIGK
jgi:hypothetical protein